MIHPLAQVATKNIGPNTVVWQYAIILEGARIGDHCNINCHTFIENQVSIGDAVTIKSGVYLWDGITIKDKVFVGPNAAFVNDRYPRSRRTRDWFPETILEEGCSIGAGAILLDKVRIGKYALVAAGAVVTKDVPDYGLVAGNPSRLKGWVDEAGHPLQQKNGKWHSLGGGLFEEVNGILHKIHE